eukprot:scaffold3661_cov403-Prasinococcus_capsulatus_cf.AAC.4
MHINRGECAGGRAQAEEGVANMEWICVVLLGGMPEPVHEHPVLGDALGPRAHAAVPTVVVLRKPVSESGALARVLVCGLRHGTHRVVNGRSHNSAATS